MTTDHCDSVRGVVCWGVRSDLIRLGAVVITTLRFPVALPALALCLSAADAGDLVGPELPMRCRAVEMGDGNFRLDGNPFFQEPTLVVLGKVTGRTEPGGSAEPITNIEVEK